MQYEGRGKAAKVDENVAKWTKICRSTVMCEIELLFHWAWCFLFISWGRNFQTNNWQILIVAFFSIGISSLLAKEAGLSISAHKSLTLLKADTLPRPRKTTPNISLLYAMKSPGIFLGSWYPSPATWHSHIHTKFRHALAQSSDLFEICVPSQLHRTESPLTGAEYLVHVNVGSWYVLVGDTELRISCEYDGWKFYFFPRNISFSHHLW